MGGMDERSCDKCLQDSAVLLDTRGAQHCQLGQVREALFQPGLVCWERL